MSAGVASYLQKRLAEAMFEYDSVMLQLNYGARMTNATSACWKCHVQK
jgi:hypothetical protein